MAKKDEGKEGLRKRKRAEADEHARDELLMRAEVVQLLQLAREFQRTLTTLEQHLGGKVPEALPPPWNTMTRETLDHLLEALERWNASALEQNEATDNPGEAGLDLATGELSQPPLTEEEE